MPLTSPEKDKNRSAFFAALIILIVLACAAFSTALDGSRLLTERDLSVFFIPPRLLWIEQVKNFEFPLWNPYTYGGQPLFATLQPGVLYPLNIILLLLPFDLAFNWTIIIHFILAGAFMYLLAGELGAAGAGALISAVVFMLSGYLFSAHNLVSTLFTVAWAPCAVLLFLRSVKKGSYFYALLTGVVLTVMFFGGGIEALFATVLVFAFIAVFPATFDCCNDARKPLGKRGSLFASVVVVFLLLSAVQLLPFLELAEQSTRAGGLSFNEATTWSLGFKDFIQFFIPDPFGYGVTTEKYWTNQSWLKTIYIGPVSIVLAVFFLSRHGRKALPALALFFIFLVLALGKNTPVYQLLYSYLPFFNKFRYPVKFLFVNFILLSLAAGLGYGALKEGLKNKKHSTLKIIRVLLALSTLAALLFGMLNFYGAQIKDYLVLSGIDYPDYNRAEINIFNTKRALFFFIAITVAIYLAKAQRLSKALPYAVLLLLSIDLFFAHNGFYSTTDAGTYHSKGEVMEYLSNDKTLYRTFVTPKTMRESIEVPDDGSFDKTLLKSMNLDKERLVGYNLEHHMADVGGVEVMRRGDFMAVYEAILSQGSIDSANLLTILNVKYVISIPKIESKEYRLVKIAGIASDNGSFEEYKTIKVYENLKYLPRFYTVTDYEVINEKDKLLEKIKGKSFDPSKKVLLFEEPWVERAIVKTGGSLSRVEVVSYKNNSIELDVDLRERAILVASENWQSGWKAYIDGVEAKILRADYILRGVPIEAGRHRVRFEYCPASFRTGAAISTISLMSLAAAGMVLRRREAKTDAR